MIPLDAARRIALAALGFDRPRPRKPDARHIGRAIRELGLVQIDPLNVLVPAHYLVLFSRLGPYSRARFDELVYRDREFTEHRVHEASIVPVEMWPLLRHRRASCRVRPRGFESFLEQHQDYVAWVLEQVRERGPLAAADLLEPEGVARRVDQAWLGTVPRVVLETLFGRGVLGIAGRRSNFAPAYDLAERLVAAGHLDLRVEREDADREMVRRAARAYGIATADDLADYFRMSLGEARPRIAELVAAGELVETQVEGWHTPAYLDPSARAPRRIEAASLLSPFDPLIWYRPRLSRLFGFDYRIEIYTPPADRKYGYYVLPFLVGDRLVARVDLKADRKHSRLLVLSTHLEPGVRKSDVSKPLSTELAALAEWLGVEAPAAAF